ncbi:MAG: hypothetical protein ACE5HI_19820 [bacterium]
MSTKKKIQSKIEKKKEEILEYQAKIREAEASIQAFQEVLRVLPRENGIGGETLTIRSSSLAGKARNALRKKGFPMHINKIMEDTGIPKNKRQSLSGTLSHYVRKGEIFTRPEPGTFGLVEFGEKSNSEEPPENFGTMTDA